MLQIDMDSERAKKAAKLEGSLKRKFPKFEDGRSEIKHVAASLITCGEISTNVDEPENDVIGTAQDSSPDDTDYFDANGQSTTNRRLYFEPITDVEWGRLCESNGSELDPPSFFVEADKGFTFISPESHFVCYKKNHFQITTHIGPLSESKMYVRTEEGLQFITGFFLHFYGVKTESQTQIVAIEHSQSDRRKQSFHPVKVDLHRENFTKATVGRLHFADTTLHNMRKKGRSNPDQRYFRLVVALHAHCIGDCNFPIIAHASENIVVRASNPGQFENDPDVMWQKVAGTDMLYHMGNVGINTNSPSEALVVRGNISLTGLVLQPSDRRAKTIVKKLDSKDQLDKMGRINIYKYTYDAHLANEMGFGEQQQKESTGVIAQEVEAVIPDAVIDSGDWLTVGGDVIQNFKLVDKDRIYMESVGAVKELCNITSDLRRRVGELETVVQTLQTEKSHSALRSPVFYVIVLLFITLITAACITLLFDNSSVKR